MTIYYHVKFHFPYCTQWLEQCWGIAWRMLKRKLWMPARRRRLLALCKLYVCCLYKSYACISNCTFQIFFNAVYTGLWWYFNWILIDFLTSDAAMALAPVLEGCSFQWRKMLCFWPGWQWLPPPALRYWNVRCLRVPWKNWRHWNERNAACSGLEWPAEFAEDIEKTWEDPVRIDVCRLPCNGWHPLFVVDILRQACCKGKVYDRTTEAHSGHWINLNIANFNFEKNVSFSSCHAVGFDSFASLKP